MDRVKMDFEAADNDLLLKTYLADGNLHPRLVDLLPRPLPAGFRPEQIKISWIYSLKKFIFERFLDFKKSKLVQGPSRKMSKRDRKTQLLGY